MDATTHHGAASTTDVQQRELRDVSIVVRDGTTLIGDVFLPSSPEAAPVILTYGPYGKDIHFADFHPRFYESVDERGPNMVWEIPNPDWWTQQGYAVVRVDERGTGKSPGKLDLFSEQEQHDFYDVIEWAGTQPWSTGRVGLLGVSYYAILQWRVAVMRPLHLAAIVPWEAAADFYRDFARHGGIFNSDWLTAWWRRQITRNQHGLTDQDDAQDTLDGNNDMLADLKAHETFDDYHRARQIDLSRIDVPVLSAGNWGGYALHLGGNSEGYLQAGSDDKWLEMHTGNHLAPFYTSESRELQKRFLDEFVKGVDTGIRDEPRVKLAVRSATGWQWRAEESWPLSDTRWTRFHLDSLHGALGKSEPPTESNVEYSAENGSALFLTPPMTDRWEITGPVAAHLTVSTTGTDMDLFLSLIVLDPDGSEICFDDVQDVPGPVTRGWLRVSHRALDHGRSTSWNPVHTHATKQLLTPGEIVDVAVSVRPTSVVLAEGQRLGLVIGAADRKDAASPYYAHTDPEDRALSRVGTHTIHTGPGTCSYLVLPVIPPRG